MMSTEYLRSILDYDQATGIFRWKERPDFPSNRNSALTGTIAGYIDKAGYRIIRINRRAFKAHRLAWQIVYGQDPKGNIDHRNRRKGDNRIINLRLATFSENGFNRNASRNNSSGFKGVCFMKRKGLWQAKIGVRGKRIYLGEHATAELAHAAYREAADRLHGEFANA